VIGVLGLVDTQVAAHTGDWCTQVAVHTGDWCAHCHVDTQGAVHTVHTVDWCALSC